MLTGWERAVSTGLGIPCPGVKVGGGSGGQGAVWTVRRYGGSAMALLEGREGLQADVRPGAVPAGPGSQWAVVTPSLGASCCHPGFIIYSF